MNSDVLDLWSGVLNAVPGSKLILKFHNHLSDAALADPIRERFSANGITNDRIELVASIDNFNEHLTHYHQGDIALDTFPFSGATTTFQALWMGLPVVSLHGKRFISRMGESICRHAGLGNLCAATPKDYIETCASLAQNLDHLKELRLSLRDQVAASPLCDGVAYTRNFEDALQDMWNRELDRKKGLSVVEIMNRAEKRRQKKLTTKASQKALGRTHENISNLFATAVQYHKSGQLKEAEGLYQEILSINPDLPEVHCNLGIVQNTLGHSTTAERSYRHAIALKPDYAEAYNNLGNALKDLEKLDEAVAHFHKALAIKPDYLDPVHRQTKVNLSMNLLRSGHLKEGWDYFESRFSFAPDQQRKRETKAAFFQQPQWDGSTLVEKRIILWGDQGLGDEVRYASIIPDLQKTGADVTIECDKRLTDIFSRSFPDATILAAPHGGAAKEPEQFDYQSPLASLARFFRNDYESFANDGPGYLKADPALITFWDKRLKDISARPKVGLSWSSFVQIPLRTPLYASIEELAPILNISGVDFVNLQNFECNEDIAEARERFGIEIHSWNDLDNRNDLNGLAALTSCLDLVISYPGFNSELAGSLGVPTLCFVNHKDSIEELGSKDNIWYLNTHHVCKNRNEPWQLVFEEIAEITQSKFGL